MKIKPLLILLGCLAVFGTLLAVGLLPRLQRGRALAAAAREEAVALPPVTVVRVQRAKDAGTLVLPGTIESVTDASIQARAEGYLRKRYVGIGDRVQAGQVLAELEAPELEQQVRQALAQLAQQRATLGQVQAALTQAQAQLKLAGLTRERWQRLVKNGILPRQEGDEKQAVYDVREADVRAAEANIAAVRDAVAAGEANLQRLRELQSFLQVRAPFAGVITVRNTDIGELIRPGGPELFHLAQMSPLRMLIDVPQREAVNVRVGQRAEIQVTELPRKQFGGRITRTSNAISGESRTLRTEIMLDNPQGLLLPGMYAQARLNTPEAQPALLIPGDTILVRGGAQVVACLPDGKTVRLRQVTLGRDYGTEVEVLSGLSEGDIIVANPNDDIREGVTVRHP